jgi:nitrite reductase/ring-hydroxylating ferredoxin subunit/alkylhydroperoxidase/carboxymuconolactone decarboxylase family protein YurZ
MASKSADTEKVQEKLSREQQTANPAQAIGPWDSTLDQLREWDPQWADACLKMSTNPSTNGVLPAKTVELIGVALNVACTNLNPDGTRRHIRTALDAGATRDEILMVLKMGSLLAIHSCSLAAPILLEEARAAGAQIGDASKNPEPTPAVDKVRAIGQWNQAWDPFYNLDPVWTDQFMATGIGIYAGALMPPKLVEFLSIAFDASYTHMYAPGTRRHIKTALALGATVEEIMEVLKLCVVQGVQTCNLGIPILAEELMARENGKAKSNQSSVAENYIEAAKLDALPPGRSTSVTIAGKEIALFNVAGTIYAIDDACLHHGVSLGHSKFEGEVVTCSGHGWKYDLTTGGTLHVPDFGVASYPVTVVDGKILVAVSVAVSNDAVEDDLHP